ncbi:hypothetical protein PsYK624_091630 [Phanerochaete sordida]|uniref:Uncharacterized protein n=1 Tax=Phanerochaete sordida TaxID=48140 RepID=A0A9P3GG01_9APHY|nr:hypothetical protein PsYK624_091630 [Phanerochaete sordida]
MTMEKLSWIEVEKCGDDDLWTQFRLGVSLLNVSNRLKVEGSLLEMLFMAFKYLLPPSFSRVSVRVDDAQHACLIHAFSAAKPSVSAHRSAQNSIGDLELRLEFGPPATKAGTSRPQVSALKLLKLWTITVHRAHCSIDELQCLHWNRFDSYIRPHIEHLPPLRVEIVKDGLMFAHLVCKIIAGHLLQSTYSARKLGLQFFATPPSGYLYDAHLPDEIFPDSLISTARENREVRFNIVPCSPPPDFKLWLDSDNLDALKGYTQGLIWGMMEHYRLASPWEAQRRVIVNRDPEIRPSVGYTASRQSWKLCHIVKQEYLPLPVDAARYSGASDPRSDTSKEAQWAGRRPGRTDARYKAYNLDQNVSVLQIANDIREATRYNVEREVVGWTRRRRAVPGLTADPWWTTKKSYSDPTAFNEPTRSDQVKVRRAGCWEHACKRSQWTLKC